MSGWQVNVRVRATPQRGRRHGWSLAAATLHRAAVAFMVTLFALVTSAAAQEPRIVLPPGLVDMAITTVSGGPTDLAWLGDDLLIATQEGRLYRLAKADPHATPIKILDLTAHIGKGQEQGLLGVIADPDFPTRPYLYVFYTRARGSDHCLVLPANCHNRVGRFTMGADGTVDPASERPLVDNLMVGSMHNAGDLAFDAEDRLYISTGDAGYRASAQELTNLHGKILRLDRDGSPAPDNPFAAPVGQPCAMGRPPGATTPCGEIYAVGLRNPFRLAFDPNRPEDRFFINDVGYDTWEEIDRGIAGADYGWPQREGSCPLGIMGAKDDGCWIATRFVAPLYAYPHSSGCFTITGGAFVPERSPWGAAYQGTYLFADWGCGTIFRLSVDFDGRYAASPVATGLPTIVPLLFSPDGRTLYYAQDGGIVRAIAPQAVP